MTDITSKETITFNLDLLKPDTNHRFSSSELNDLITSGCISSDFLYTYISRYPRLDCDLQNTYHSTTLANGDVTPATNSNGLAIDFTAQNQWAAILQTLFVVCVAAVNGFVTYNGIRKGKDRVSATPVYDNVLNNKHSLDLDNKVPKQLGDMKEPAPLCTTDFHAVLNAALKANIKLSDRYKEISVKMIELHPDEQKKIEADKEALKKLATDKDNLNFWYNFWKADYLKHYISLRKGRSWKSYFQSDSTVRSQRIRSHQQQNWEITLLKQPTEVDYEICDMTPEIRDGKVKPEKGILYVDRSKHNFTYRIAGMEKNSAAITNKELNIDAPSLILVSLNEKDTIDHAKINKILGLHHAIILVKKNNIVTAWKQSLDGVEGWEQTTLSKDESATINQLPFANEPIYIDPKSTLLTKKILTVVEKNYDHHNHSILTLEELNSRKSLIFKKACEQNNIILENDSWGTYFKNGLRAFWSRIVKTADAISDMLGLTSYSYWVLYIGAAVVTGAIGIGVIGLSAYLGFGIPFLAGAAFILQKSNNWKKNRSINKQARDDFNALTEASLLNEEEKNALRSVPEDSVNLYNERNTSKITVPTSSLVIATTGLSTVVGAYVAWEYNMWYISDLIVQLGGSFSLELCSAIGIGIFAIAVVSCVRAGYDAYQAYKKNKEDNKYAPKEQGEDLSFWEYCKSLRSSGKSTGFLSYFKLNTTILLEKQHSKIEDLEIALLAKEEELKAAGIPKISTPILDARLKQARDANNESQSKSAIIRVISNVWHVLNFGMTGAFVARTVVIQGIVSFLLPGLVVAASVGTMGAALAIIVAVGIAWGVYRYCAHRQAKNILKLKEANNQIELLEKKINILHKQKSADNKSSPELTTKSEPPTIAVMPTTPAPTIAALNPTVELLPLTNVGPVSTTPTVVDQKQSTSQAPAITTVEITVGTSKNRNGFFNKEATPTTNVPNKDKAEELIPVTASAAAA